MTYSQWHKYTKNEDEINHFKVNNIYSITLDLFTKKAASFEAALYLKNSLFRQRHSSQALR